uniref:Phospholipid scramblase n=1 Tax=Oryzias latipes TaxID=8090 RepID=A0A3P9MDC9_ORYLA
MSVVMDQPFSFGKLERQKPIQMISGSFENRCRPSCSRQVQPLGQNSHQAPRDRESEDQLSQMGMHRSSVKTSRVQGEVEEQRSAAGRQFLSFLDTVLCCKGIALIFLSVFSFTVGPHCVSRNIYSISMGDSRSQLFATVEESSCVCLHCCGPARACSLEGVDCKRRQVFYFERPLRVDACGLGCCLMEIRAYLPQKLIIGTVGQRWSMFTPLLEVCDSEGSSTIRIQGSCCPGHCFSDQEFQIVSSIGEPIGKHNMDHDCFALEVQSTLESHNKLVLLAATFLLVSRSSLQYVI